VSVPTRAALSRELIAQTALALTDEGGLAGLSMRKLGNELGVEAMSLYHYVDNKDDLLDAILDTLFGEVELPMDVPDENWELAVRRGLRSFHEVLVRHPAALELFASRPAKTDQAVRVLLWSFGRFQAVGLDVERSAQAFHVAVSFVMGHVALELGAMALIRAGGGMDVDAVDDPALRQLIQAQRDVESNVIFEAGLDVAVAGLRHAFELP